MQGARARVAVRRQRLVASLAPSTHRTDVKALKGYFDEHDSDCDGNLDLDGFRQVLKKLALEQACSSCAHLPALTRSLVWPCVRACVCACVRACVSTKPALRTHRGRRSRHASAAAHTPRLTRRPRHPTKAAHRYRRLRARGLRAPSRGELEAVHARLGWRVRVQVSGKRKHIVFEWDQAESKFHSLDVDGNGLLDFGELLSILFPQASEHEARRPTRWGESLTSPASLPPKGILPYSLPHALPLRAAPSLPSEPAQCAELPYAPLRSLTPSHRCTTC